MGQMPHATTFILMNAIKLDFLESSLATESITSNSDKSWNTLNIVWTNIVMICEELLLLLFLIMFDLFGSYF